MRLATLLMYDGNPRTAADQVVALEKAGLDQVWVAEAYSFDSISQVGYLSAITDRIEIGTGIVNVYSRTAALMAMTAAGCDYVSGGRFILGLGASGPQVVEGFHGVPYEKPMMRTKEYIEACRMIWKPPANPSAAISAATRMSGQALFRPNTPPAARTTAMLPIASLREQIQTDRMFASPLRKR